MSAIQTIIGNHENTPNIQDIRTMYKTKEAQGKHIVL